MAGGRQLHHGHAISVRHGQVVAHLSDPELAADLIRRLATTTSRGEPASRTPSCSGVTDEAVAIGLMAQEVVGALGAQTLAKGLSAMRAQGHRMPWHLVRSARALDSAASLLKHPGAAAAAVADIRAWVDKEEYHTAVGQAQIGRAHV